MQNKVDFIMLTASHWSMVLAAYCAVVFERVFPPTVLASRWLEELQVVRQFQGKVANIMPVNWLTKKPLTIHKKPLVFALTGRHTICSFQCGNSDIQKNL
jgi:hypothetical protein